MKGAGYKWLGFGCFKRKSSEFLAKRGKAVNVIYEVARSLYLVGIDGKRVDIASRGPRARDDGGAFVTRSRNVSRLDWRFRFCHTEL